MRTLPFLLLLSVLLSAVLAAPSSPKQKPYNHQGLKKQGHAVIASKGDLYFKGCREQRCHQGLYDGYNCRAGHCDYVCDHVACYESSRVKAAYAKKAKNSQKSRARWPWGGALKGKSQFNGKSKFSGSKVDFSGCKSEYCKSGEYEGYDCKNGHCGYVCKGADCYFD